MKRKKGEKIVFVFVIILVLALSACPVDNSDETDTWRSLSEAIQDYRETHGYPAVIETTCCWSGSDYKGDYNYARVVFQSWTIYFYCYTTGIYADDGWFW